MRAMSWRNASALKLGFITRYPYIIDDCCKLRNTIRSLFGQDITVKVDIFHVVQRVTKIPSKINY
jgi:hypothetical protein